MLPDLPRAEAAIIEMTNTFRKARNLQEVKPNSALAAAARAFAQYLASSGRFGHEADGRKPHERAEAQGYDHCLVAENLAWNADSRGFETRRLAEEIVEGWKESPGHRDNLLLAEATEIGVAVVPSPYRMPKFIAVQMMGRPDSARVRFTIRNLTRAPVRYTLGGETDTLAPSSMVTHDRCDLPELTFEKTGGAPARFAPRNGDRFIVRAGKGSGIEVETSAK